MEVKEIIKREYIQWEKNALGEKSSIECIICLERTSEYIIKKHISQKSIWEIVNYEEFSKIHTELLRRKDFYLFDKDNCNVFNNRAGFSYSKFLLRNEARLSKLLFVDLQKQSTTKSIPPQTVTKQMTIAEAIIEVLKIKSPLSSFEIYKEIIDRGLYTFKAVTPTSVVLNTLMNHSEGNNSYDRTSKRKYFKILYLHDGKKKFELIDEEFLSKSFEHEVVVEAAYNQHKENGWIDTIIQEFGEWILKQGKAESTSRQYANSIKTLVQRYQDEFKIALKEIDIKDKMLRFIELLIINPQFIEVEAAPAQHNRFTSALQSLREFFGVASKIRKKNNTRGKAGKTKAKSFRVSEAVAYNWESNDELYGSKPFSVSFVEIDKKIEVKSWKHIFIELCEYIIERRPDFDFLLCNDKYKGRRILCSVNELELFSPRRLSNGQFVETNHSSNRLIKIAKMFLQYADEDLAKIEIYYFPSSGSTHLNPDKQTYGNNNGIEKRVVELVKTKRLEGAVIDEIVDGLSEKRARILNAIRTSSNIIELGSGRYVYDGEFIDLDKAREIMKDILQRYFARLSGVATSKILYDAVKVKLQMFLNDNDLDDEQKIYWLARHFFDKTGDEKYYFYANCFIWQMEPSYPKSIAGLLINLAKNNGGFISKVEAMNYLNQLKLSTQIQQAMGFSSSKRDFVLYNDEEYLYFPLAEISGEGLNKIQKSLNRYFDDNPEETFIVIRDIDDNWLALLPPLPFGKPWTLLLLQDAICQNDLGFETIRCLKGQDAGTLQAAIVRKKDRMSFADVVWDFLNKKYSLPREFGVDELRFLIRDAGMIAGNELIYGMHKALNERRFVWKNNDTQVKVLALAR